jgi:hypothetical protein
LKQKCIFAGSFNEQISIHIKYAKMKKTLLLVVAILAGLTGFAQVSDTIVSMTPSNRNVLLEEYTGVGCQFCPDGHKRANEIKAAHPDRVCLINIHQGGYASNTYTTQFGDALANQTGLDGYPAGTVNRHVFSGSVTSLNRGNWATAANTILNMSSPVNIAAEGTLDWSTRTLNIRVQLYYTASQSVSSNSLNVAIIQDNVLGSQTGATTWYPEMMVGNQYRHMHMLRHLITGQWGETISTIASGTLVEKNYEYVIPQQMGSPNAISAPLEDLVFVAFVCEGHQEVLTSIEVPIQHLNLPAIAGRISGAHEITNTNCTDVTNVEFDFTNLGGNTITSLAYTYTLNGTAHNETWTGSIASMQSGTVTLPDLNLNLGTNNSLQINVTAINGESITATPASLTLKKNVYTGGGNMKFKLVTDRYADETTFKFFGPNGNVVLSGGPWSQLSANGTTVHEFGFNPPTTGCYRLEVYDGYGDGINGGYGAGYFQLFAEDGTQIFKDNGKFGAQATYMIDVTHPAGIEDVAAGTSIYPNPATDVINISTSDNVLRVEIFNIQGQLVKAATGEMHSISVKDLANGLYTLKLTTDNGTTMHKIIKK